MREPDGRGKIEKEMIHFIWVRMEWERKADRTALMISNFRTRHRGRAYCYVSILEIIRIIDMDVDIDDLRNENFKRRVKVMCSNRIKKVKFITDMDNFEKEKHYWFKSINEAGMNDYPNSVYTMEVILFFMKKIMIFF